MTSSALRSQSLCEDIANAISHGMGLLLILAAAPFLLAASFDRGGVLAFVCAGIFAVTVAILYGSSMLYHALRPGKIKQLFRVIDHSAIFLLIAGTYTPFALGALRGPWGWSLFGIVWAIATAGIGIEVSGLVRHRKLSVALYLVMGWLVVIATGQLLEHVQARGILLLAAGGLAYTVGVVFYVMKRLPYAHLIWHFFVLAGTTCHFFAVMHYAV
jgi:hemolysin III